MSNSIIQKIKIYEEMFKDVIRDETCSELDITRKNSWEFFSNTGFPTSRKKNELWKYTNLNPIEKNSYELDSNEGVSLIQINHKESLMYQIQKKF